MHGTICMAEIRDRMGKRGNDIPALHHHWVGSRKTKISCYQ